MELSREDIGKLRTLITEWEKVENLELEASFSDGSDTSSFLSVAQRLRAKGFEALPQEDKMNIITPENVRFTLIGLTSIEKYCRDNSLIGKPFEAIIKDRSGTLAAESTIDLDDYGVRVKVRRELQIAKNDPALEDLLRNWDRRNKAFRIMRRWTFLDVKGGVRYDLSMVRSTPTTKPGGKGNYKWQKNFLDIDLAKEPPHYEIEVEMLRSSSEGSNVDLHVKNLIRGIGEVLRGIQKHSLLLRKSVERRVKKEYEKLTNLSRFRGVNPVTMISENMSKKVAIKNIANVRTGYNVTDKADGLRMMGFVDESGELFLMDMSMHIYKTGLMEKKCANSLVDGEFVTRDKEGKAIQQYIVFDIYIAPSGRDVSPLRFSDNEGNNREEGRYKEMTNWMSHWADSGAKEKEKGKISLSVKTFLFGRPGDDSIFSSCKTVLNTPKVYHTDGLILTPNALRLPSTTGAFHEQLKWKPASENTVDFLVIFDKNIEDGMDQIIEGIGATGESIFYKSMRLYVGSELDAAFEDPRQTVLSLQPLPATNVTKRTQRREFKPVLFNPKDMPDTMASIAYSKVETDIATNEDFVKCENDDPIQDRSIIEMRYDTSLPPGWRWIPLRVRYDKTERFQTGKKGSVMNKDSAAEDVWNSIHDPITQYMISTGSEKDIPLKKASGIEDISDITKVYYERKASKDDMTIIANLRRFHNNFIKENILLASGLYGGGKTLVDLACGQGGDLHKWLKLNASFVYGTDIAEKNITNPDGGAYDRYLKEVRRAGGYENIAKMIFTIGTSSRLLANGDAGKDEQEANIMRAVYGQLATKEGSIPLYVKTYGMGKLEKGADCVALMFALHYFFDKQESLDTLIRNIADSLKVGGLFIGCCFDGEKMFNALRRIEEKESLIGTEKGVEIWKITKQYGSEKEFPTTEESIGLPIDVEFISIGTKNTEYLVNFEFLKKKLAAIGCELLSKKECAELKLSASTEMFEDTLKKVDPTGKNLSMILPVKQYSSFNRWFIFKRTKISNFTEEVVPDAPASPAAPAAPASPEVSRVSRIVGSQIPRKLTKAQLFEFYIGSKEVSKDKDVLKLGDLTAKRHLALNAHFPITDYEDNTVYPSVEYYLGGMKYKKATGVPEQGKKVFSENGMIYRTHMGIRTTQTAKGTIKLTDEKEVELLKEENKDVTVKSILERDSEKLSYDHGKWVSVRNEYLRKGLLQRWERDERFRNILIAAREKNLYLVYIVAGDDYLGGKYDSKENKIIGENMVGKIMMEIAGF